MPQYDGYYTDFNTGEIVMYRDAAINKVSRDDVFKIDLDKISTFESFCKTLKSTFMDTGWLRLHMPIDYHQEVLGTTFLCVPQIERARVMNITQCGTLVTTDIGVSNSFDMRNFIVMETGMHISMADLIGMGELIDLEQFRTWFQANCSSPEEVKRQMEITVSTKFFLIQNTVEGMFINRKKNWLEKIVG